MFVRLKGETLEGNLVVIRSYYVDTNNANDLVVFDSLYVKRLLRGIKSINVYPRKSRLPISLALLERIVIKLRTLYDININVAVTYIFARFLRLREFIYYP